MLDAFITALSSRTMSARLLRSLVEKDAWQATHREHLDILRAIVERDSEAARIRMGAHLLSVQQSVQDRGEGTGPHHRPRSTPIRPKEYACRMPITVTSPTRT